MRAAVFKAVGQPLAIENVPEPVPGHGEVVVKVGRCGICGTDLHWTDGHATPVPAGSVLGHEYSGEVVALGPGIERLKVGDRVAAMPMRGCGRCGRCLAGQPMFCATMRGVYGGFAEYATAGEKESIKLPSSLSLADGALVEPLAVALHGVATAGIVPGAHVMVMGAGPIGLGSVFWARKLGAGGITVIEGQAARAELAMTMGATRCLAPQNRRIAMDSGSFGGSDDGDAPDIVIECVGRPGLLAQAIAQVRTHGTVVSLGCGMESDAFIPAAANVKEVTMKFPIVYSLRDFQVTADVLDSGAVEPRAMITETVGFPAFPTAFEALRAGSGNCKLMVDPWA